MSGDERSLGWQRDDQAAFAKLLDGAADSPERDAVFSGQVPFARQSRSRCEFAGGDAEGDVIGDADIGVCGSARVGIELGDCTLIRHAPQHRVLLTCKDTQDAACRYTPLYSAAYDAGLWN